MLESAGKRGGGNKREEGSSPLTVYSLPPAQETQRGEGKEDIEKCKVIVSEG